ncbi:MAG: hypothetical protein B1H03_03640 [Planctomycetales bacterium 4484_113]|nr:MAG: hypothetical protein B1H03_03640 [Planctomycetales bacterium 4484_113]
MASPETTSRADLAQVERAIREVLLGADEMVLTYLEQVAQGIGKRLRPQMLITFADLFGNSKPDSVVNCAACSELLHTASLIHDDVIDTAESRRGLPTINGRHGNEIAVIVGDYLLALVFQRLIAMQDIKLLKLVVTASQHLGIGIIEEVRNRNNLALSEEDYTNIIRLKTGALFALVCEMGAYLGGANEEQSALCSRPTDVTIRATLQEVMNDASNAGCLSTLGNPCACALRLWWRQSGKPHHATPAGFGHLDADGGRQRNAHAAAPLCPAAESG